MRQEGTNGPTWLKRRYIRVHLPIRSATRVREEAYTFYAYFILSRHMYQWIHQWFQIDIR